MKTKKFGIGAIFSIVILGIALFAFILAPVLGARGVGMQGQISTYASWDGKKVQDGPNSNLWAQLNSLRKMASMFQMKPPTDPVQKQYWDYSFRRVAIDATVIDIAMETYVEEAGYEPSKKLINNAIIRQFTDYSTGTYSQALHDEQYRTEADKLENRKNTVKNLKRARYIKDVLGYGDDQYGLKTSSKEIAFIQSMNTEKRRLEYVAFSSLDFPNEKILEYAKESKDLFVKYNFSVIPFSNESAANNVSSAITKGETTFDTAFENRDKELKDFNFNEEGKLVNSYRKDINTLFPNAEDLNAVISLKPSEVSKPLKLNSVFVIMKCNANPTQPNFENSELVEKVFSHMRQYDKGKIEDYLMEKAGKFVASVKESSFDDAVANYAVEKLTSTPFALNYGSSNMLEPIPFNTDPIIAPASTNDDFLKAVFSLNTGETSKPFLIGDKAVVCKLIETVEADSEQSKTRSNRYASTLQGWDPYYTLAMLTRQRPINLAQSIIIDFILKNPKLTDYNIGNK